MSTAGKVLVVLVLLVIPIWVILAAAVADLNTNWNKALIAQRAQIDTLEKGVKANRDNITKLKDETTLEQHEMEKQLDVLRGRLTEVERARSEIITTQKDVTYRKETVLAELKTAETNRETRKAEKAAEEKAKKAAEDEVEVLKGANADLLARLDKLRTAFKATLDENRKMVDRLLKKTGVERTNGPAPSRSL